MVNEHMSPETQSEVIRINVKMLSGLAALLMIFIGGVAWFTRLEYRTETNRDDSAKISLQLETVRNDRARDNDRLTRAESQMTFILQGIEEIKGLLKERKVSQ